MNHLTDNIVNRIDNDYETQQCSEDIILAKTLNL